MEEALERWYTVSTLANHWKVSRSTLYRFIKLGHLESSVLGGRIVVTSSQASNFIRKLELGMLLSDNSQKI